MLAAVMQTTAQCPVLKVEIPRNKSCVPYIFFRKTGILMAFVYAMVAINLISIFACHLIAKNRGSKPVFWGVMGAVFGPLAIPFALISGRNP
jgi:hypothetical protein